MVVNCVCVQGGEKAQQLKKKMDFASTSVWEKAGSPTLILKPENSTSPHMFQVPLELLPQHCSSERVSLSVSKSL